MSKMPQHPLEAYPVKASFWVIKNYKPEFVSGELQLEEEGSWCEGMERFHETNGHYYVSWFNTPEEALQNEIEMAQFRIEFETEMWEATLQELTEDRDTWVKRLEGFKSNVVSKSE